MLHRSIARAGEEQDMGTGTNEKSGPPQVVILDNAFKLAERWVDNMTKVADEEPEKTEPEPEPESRPSRLGLGAKFSHQFKPGASSDPVERKLFANLQARNRKAAQENEETVDSDSEDDDVGSRSAAFAKKRMPPPVGVGSLPTIKKKKVKLQL